MAKADHPAHRLNFKAGELVEVRSEEEILSTLDGRGMLEQLPFMPEMLRHCGRRFRVAKRADKTCDTIHKTGGRRMWNAVHLEVRCDGSAHGNCQAACLVFWKEAWLKRVGTPVPETSTAAHEVLAPVGPCTRTDLEAAAAIDDGDTSGPRYMCQATELFRATTPLPWWDVRQYWRDVGSGNVRLGELLRVLGRAMLTSHWRGTRLYNLVRRMAGRPSHPGVQGRLAGRTPAERLGLQPGELVEVRSAAEIEATLSAENRNRGLRFDVEQVPFCGRQFRVLQRVERIIDEQTGRMMQLPNDCLMLEGAVCSSHYSQLRWFCPRAIYPYWREIWLRRVAPTVAPGTGPR